MPQFTRKDLYREFDELLDKLGYEQDLSRAHGKIGIEISFQYGKATLRVFERETSKEVVLAPATG